MSHLSTSAGKIFGSGRQVVVLVHSHVASPKGFSTLLSPNAQIHMLPSSINTMFDSLCSVIDGLGKASAVSQALPTTITSASKLASSPDQRLYCLIDSDRVVGILKVGRKRLFLADPRRGNDFGHAMVECQPLCILDFYVVDGQQRRGHGRRLFDAMLSTEEILVNHVAIDRPSPKMVAFLSRHYNLTRPLTQRNNFTVFESFFSGNPALARCSSGFRQNLRKSFSSDNISRSHWNAQEPQFNSVANQAKNHYSGTSHWYRSDRPPVMNEPTYPNAAAVLPPLPNGMNKVNFDGRNRFGQPMSADVVLKNKQEKSPATPPHRSAYPTAGNGRNLYEPPLLNRNGTPEAYRQIFSSNLEEASNNNKNGGGDAPDGRGQQMPAPRYPPQMAFPGMQTYAYGGGGQQRRFPNQNQNNNRTMYGGGNYAGITQKFLSQRPF